MNALPLTSSDLNNEFAEPRIGHRQLASALGFVQHHKLRHLVERNLPEFERYGEVPSTADVTGPKGGRPGKILWLNEGQCILAAVRSDAPLAVDVRYQVITVFMAYRRSQCVVPVKAHERRKSVSTEVALRLKTNVDRLDALLVAHERASVLDTVGVMLWDMRKREDAHRESMRVTAQAIEDMVRGAPQIC